MSSSVLIVSSSEINDASTDVGRLAGVCSFGCVCLIFCWKRAGAMSRPSASSSCASVASASFGDHTLSCPCGPCTSCTPPPRGREARPFAAPVRPGWTAGRRGAGPQWPPSSRCLPPKLGGSWPRRCLRPRGHHWATLWGGYERTTKRKGTRCSPEGMVACRSRIDAGRSFTLSSFVVMRRLSLSPSIEKPSAEHREPSALIFI